MFQNYLKIACRNLFKHKGFSLINIAGLATGLTCSILILLLVRHELSYDRFHAAADRIYRIAWINENPQTRTPHPMAQAMVRDFPDVVQAVSLSPIWGPGLTRPTFSVRYGDRQFDEKGFFSADSTFFELFSFRLVKGDPERALKEFGGIVITETIATKYFGDEEPVGKMLTVDFGEPVDIMVTGVVEDTPANSHFNFDFLVSYVTLKQFEDGEYYEWSDFGHYNYVKLRAGADPEAIEKRLLGWAAGYAGWSETDVADASRMDLRFELQPLTDIHLHSHLKWELEPNGDIRYVYLFTAAAIFVLLIACINFMNLTTARAGNRAREVGVRKVAGASRHQLIKQFLGESFLITLLAVLIAIAMIEMTLPAFGRLTGRELAFDYGPGSVAFWSLLGLTLLVGLLSGSYPALVLSSFAPTRVLKGALSRFGGNVGLRRALVTLQFIISIVLITATAIISKQLHFLQNQKLGFNSERVLVLPMKAPAMREQYEAVKQELLRQPKILKATAVSNVPGGRFNQHQAQWPAQEERMLLSEVSVDHDFFDTMNINIASGRPFSREHATDVAQNFIINQTAASMFQWPKALNQELRWFDDDTSWSGTVIAVAEDFNFQSLHNEIEPLIFQVIPEDYNYLLVKIAAEEIPATLASVENTWQQFDPEHAFEYTFLDADFMLLYQAEERMRTVFQYFTALAVFIACLGLYGLSAFAAQQRIKEVGIRKVLGASVSSIVMLLSSDLLLLVGLANLLAWPVAYLTMQSWLRQFAYRTNVGLEIFLGAGALALVIAFITISTQAVRAAIADPVRALRCE